MVQFPIEQRVFSAYRFSDFPIKIFLWSFFAENHKTGPKRVKKTQKGIFEIDWQTQEIDFKINFTSDSRTST